MYKKKKQVKLGCTALKYLDNSYTPASNAYADGNWEPILAVWKLIWQSRTDETTNRPEVSTTSGLLHYCS